MAGTRSSARQAAAAASSSPSSSQSKPTSDGATSGSKRKGGPAASPKAKRGKKGDKKEQTTIEESMPQTETNDNKDIEMKDEMEPMDKDKAQAMPEGGAQNGGGVSEKGDSTIKADLGNSEGRNEAFQNGDNASKSEEEQKMDDTTKVKTADGAGKDNEASNGTTAVESSTEREESTPSSILEKGVVYFFERGRVGIDEPSSTDEIARSYIVSRPMPHGAKLGEGPLGDAGHNRLIALPKKVLPKSPKDRFMAFVEKANISTEDLKGTMGASDYATKTAGTRHSPPMAPLAEGVYAITSTGRESHLAYILTIPSEIGEVQQDIGLQKSGSFVTSVKNPTSSGPANASLPKGPEYPQEFAIATHRLASLTLMPFPDCWMNSVAFVGCLCNQSSWTTRTLNFFSLATKTMLLRRPPINRIKMRAKERTNPSRRWKSWRARMRYV